MAKRKLARPASRARKPGAGRGSRPSPRTSTKRSAPARSAATTRARRAGAAKAKKTATDVRKTAAKRPSAAAKAPVRTAKRPSAVKPVAGRSPRTLVLRRQGSAPAKGGPAPSSPKRSPGGRAAASRPRRVDRDRRLFEEEMPTPPSSLDLDRRPSAARAGRAEMEEALLEHTSTGPSLTGGDLDADWESAYSTGDEAPGGDMPTPDQAVVEEIGTAIGVEYADNEELKGVDKIERRDRHRWELDPASSEDYQDRARPKRR